MADWTKSMQQTYEFYIVNPNTWKDEKQYNHVTSCSIERDLETDTLGSASLTITQPIEECYMRIYLVTNQNGVKEKHPLGVFLVQAPAINFNGRRSNMIADGYTPLIELKENQPPLGHYIPKYTNVMERAGVLTKENLRAPVIDGKYPKTWDSREQGYAPELNAKPASEWISKGEEAAHIGDMFLDFDWKLENDTIFRLGYKWNYNEIDKKYEWKEVSLSYDKDNMILTGDFVADPEDNWFVYISDLLKQINQRFDIDEMGRVGFASTRNLDLKQPIWTFTDDNSSILDANVDLDCDLFGIPNVVEVIYSNASPNNNVYVRCVAENHDPNSPLSIENRGRRITHRITDPGFVGIAASSVAEVQVKDYAKQTLKQFSTIERTITYTHGYCPVRLDDCVRFNYTRAGLTNIKARVIKQSIKCTPGCPVTEKAVYTTKLIDEDYIKII